MVPVPAAAVVAHLPVAGGISVVRDGDTTIVTVAPVEVRAAAGATAFGLLDDAARRGFWVAVLAYDLGRSVEGITARGAGRTPPAVPDIVLARYDARLVLRPGREPEVLGGGPAAELLATAAWRARAGAPPPGPTGLETARWSSSLDRDAHAAAVGAVLELLRAGDCYQVNLTRQMHTDAAADPVALHRLLETVHPAPHAALVTFGPGGPPFAVVSASPELFLACEGSQVVTRPVKGTGRDPERLAHSAKDRAENVMIVDLARNDLGRVCEYGSVVVDSLCAVESHPGLHHLVSTVRGTLRPGVTLGRLVRATFPPASVTGAPKPRVLQAIEDLEPVRRGVYCGALGWIDGDARRSSLAVAIRTFTVTPAGTHFGTGGGIVADSRPDAEWEETELKAARLLAAARALRLSGALP